MTACFNEEGNVEELYSRVRAVMLPSARYRYEHIFIDNSSRDDTVAVLKRIAARDHNVKVIVNSRNFGHVRSPMHALMQTRGDAVIGIVADLQDPPEMIAEMIKKWEDGFLMVLCVKSTSEEHRLMFWIRKKYDSGCSGSRRFRRSRTSPGSVCTIVRVVEAVRRSTIPTRTSGD